VTDELSNALRALGTGVQSLLNTMQQLCVSLEAARNGKRRAEAEALRLATVLSRVKAELDDDGHWITDLNSRKIVVEFSPGTRQAAVLSEAVVAAGEAAYLQALERLAELARAVADSPGNPSPEALAALREAVRVWRELAKQRV
jgi:hypothetical protein